MNIKNLFKNVLSKISQLNTELATVNTELDTKLTISDLKRGYLDTSVSVGGSGSAWGSVTVPNTQQIITPFGFYLYGTGATNCTLYAFNLSEDKKTISVAVRNWSGTATTITASIYYMYVDIVGG